MSATNEQEDEEQEGRTRLGGIGRRRSYREVSNLLFTYTYYLQN